MDGLERLIMGQHFLELGLGILIEQHRLADEQLLHATAQLATGRAQLFPEHRNGHIAGILTQHVHAVHDDGTNRVQIDMNARRHPSGFWSNADDSRETQGLENADIEPADIELPALDRKLRRAREGMVVVVQFLAGHQEAPGHDVASSVWALEVAIAVVVADTVDHTCRHERIRQHLRCDHDDSRNAEEQQIDDHHQYDAQIAMAQINVALHPVVGRAATELLARLGIARFRLIELSAFEQYFFQTEDHRAVRIFRGFAACMVLAVHGDPLARHDARGQP